MCLHQSASHFRGHAQHAAQVRSELHLAPRAAQICLVSSAPSLHQFKGTDTLAQHLLNRHCILRGMTVHHRNQGRSKKIWFNLRRVSCDSAGKQPALFLTCPSQIEPGVHSSLPTRRPAEPSQSRRCPSWCITGRSEVCWSKLQWASPTQRELFAHGPLQHGSEMFVPPWLAGDQPNSPQRQISKLVSWQWEVDTQSACRVSCLA